MNTRVHVMGPQPPSAALAVDIKRDSSSLFAAPEEFGGGDDDAEPGFFKAVI